MERLDQRLAELDAKGLRRRLRTLVGPQGPHVNLGGKRVLLLCSNNYLGLTAHHSVLAAGAAAAERWGSGAGSSRLISGTMEPHLALERALAEFHGYESSLIFGSGYLANLGVISTLVGPGDLVCSDRLNHASIVDGCRLSGAEKRIFRHRDLAHLESILASAQARAADRTLIVSDGVFSMDGDVAPIAALLELARRYDAMLMIDDAHGVGSLGPGGRGAVAEAALGGEVDIITGTLGKALAGYGAYACCSDRMRELLINSARSFIFSTAPPPPAVAAAHAALDTIRSRPDLVRKLGENAAVLRESLIDCGLAIGDSRTQIIPLLVGSATRAVAACELALSHGVYAQAIRPPTVPEGTSRLRLSVMASHRAEELREAAAVIADAIATTAEPTTAIALGTPIADAA